ncbi:MAG: response regulator [Proteobacteria bacterium]|nr:response regulator [Pseudomonadota bacterium]MBU1390050.1 response regulator [Pseudomonadota bacterium]MBU1544999.1 response regulator [Pseudomonadota bacterium]
MLPNKFSLRTRMLFSHLFILLIPAVALTITIYFQFTESILLISAAVFLLDLLLAMHFSNRITRSIALLQKNTDKINAGDLDTRTALQPGDDLYCLGSSINQLAHTLKQSLQQNEKLELSLQHTRDELEIRVEKRTAELKREIEDKLLVEEKYKKVMDASPVPIALYDMDGKPIYINPAFTDTFGWTLEEFSEEKTNYIPQEEYDLNIQIRRKIIKGQGGRDVETRRYNKNRELLDIIISFDVWRGKNNAPIGCVVILHDVTESKKMERQLFQARKMEAMGTLAGGIAHDFNNILSGIFAFSDLAKKHAGDAQKAKPHIEQIIKGAQRASGLVQQILTFSRKAEYQKRTIHLDLIINEALSLFKSTLPETIIIKEELSEQITILADSTQIHQVIMNLCTNAYQAMIEKGGTLTVKLNEIQITQGDINSDSYIKPGSYAHLEIHDTGHGMTRTVLEKAFDPYFTTKEIGKGTGFGLALVRAIVEAHDGHIQVYSAPEKGARFDVYLPCRKPLPAEDETESKEPAIAGGSERIMIVDDEESIRLATQEFLEDYGYQTTAFKDGKEALAAFKDNPDTYDLVLTDMTMPKMTGDMLVKELLNIRNDIPIILCTGYSEKIDESKALKAGVKFFIQKPFSNQKLDAVIRKAIDQNAQQKTPDPGTRL